MSLLILIPVIILLIIVVLIYHVFYIDLKDKVYHFKNENIDLNKEINRLEKELHDKDIRLNNKINDLKESEEIGQKVTLVNIDDLTDEFKENYLYKK